MAILVYLFTSKKFLIALGVVIVFIVVSVILKKRNRKNQLEKAETENTIYASTTNDAGNDKLERYDLSGFPGNVPYFLSKALETEAQKDFLAARSKLHKDSRGVEKTCRTI